MLSVKRMKRIVPHVIYTLTLMLPLMLKGQSQQVEYETCPVTEYINHFDAEKDYIKSPEEILLGQARVLSKDPGRCVFLDGIDLYYPTNRPGWAISVAHVNRVMSNMWGANNMIDINYWHGAVFQESFYQNGSHGEIWPPEADHNVATDHVQQCGFAGSHGDGFFHTDANGRKTVSDLYGTRFPLAGSSAGQVVTFEQNVHLAMVWANGWFRIKQYGEKLPIVSFLKDAADPLAGARLLAANYVAGQNIPDTKSIVVDNRAAAIVAPNIKNFIQTGSAFNYSTQVNGYVEAMSTPADITNNVFESSNHSWYDHQITWQDVSDYMDLIGLFYVEMDVEVAKAEIKEAFDAVNGGDPVSFRYEFAPVLDAITLSTPYYEPEIHSTQQTAYKCNFTCSLPFPTIDYDTPLEFCDGLSVELTSIVGSGYTYNWYKDGELVVGENDINFHAKESGEYTVEIEDANGCKLGSRESAKVTVNECSSCTMSVDANVTNVSCSGYADGEIAIDASGVSGPFMYKVGTKPEQSISTFTTLTEGNYFVEVSQVSDPTCKGFASTVIDADVIVSNTIELESTAIDCESVSLEANVVDLPPSQCTYTFRRFSSNENTNKWGSFPYVEVNIGLLDGPNELFNTRSLDPNDPKKEHQREFNAAVSIPNGADLSIVVNCLSGSGKSIAGPWTMQIIAPDGEVIGEVDLPGTVQSGKTVVLDGLTAICKFTRPAFTYDWSPMDVLSIKSDLTADALVPSKTLVKITAQNPDEPGCPLKDSVYVYNTCNGNVCEPATQAVVSSVNGAIEFCQGQDLALAVSTDRTDFYYQWKFNGSKINNAIQSTYTATQAGVYSVEIIDPNDETCIYESSDSEKLSLTTSSSLLPNVVIKGGKTTICDGEEVEFYISSQVNEGDLPVYEWFLNDVSESAGETYSSNSLQDGDMVKCVLTSSASCLSTDVVTSNVVSITVSNSILPTVSIKADQQEVCSGAEVTFSVESQTNQGDSPVYEWFLNGDSKGESTIFKSNELVSTDVVTVKMTVAETCVVIQIVVSNEVSVVVNENVTPVVEILGTSSQICKDDPVTFRIESSENLGASPLFKWMRNEVEVSNAVEYTANDFNNGDEIYLEATPDLACVTESKVQSSPIVLTVATSIVPVLAIKASSSTSICEGESLLFEFVSGDGVGASPVYDWLLNGVSTGQSDKDYTGVNFSDTDKISLVASDLSSCASQPTVASNEVSVSIIDPVTPEVEMFASSTNICENEKVDFLILSEVNQGVEPSYEWFVNNISVSTNTTYSTTKLLEGDKVCLELSVSETCVTSQMVPSNTETISIENAQVPSVKIDVDKKIVCPDEKVNFFIVSETNQGDTPSYEWFLDEVSEGTGDSFSTSISDSESTVYVEMTSSLSCVSSSIVPSNEITIFQSDAITSDLLLNASKNEICEGELVSFEASSILPDAKFSWEINDKVQSEDVPVFSSSSLENGDEISVELNFTNSCGSLTDSKSMSIVVAKNPLAVFAVDSIEQCSDEGEVTLSVSKITGGDFVWLLEDEIVGGVNQQDYSVSKSGEYGVEIDHPLCGVSTHYGTLVQIIQSPFVSAGEDLDVDEGDGADLQGESDAQFLEWSPSEFVTDPNIINPSVEANVISAQGQINFTLTGRNGECLSSDDMVLTVFREVEIPSAFTPNGDGYNDVWVLAGMDKFPNAIVQVFNRWGQEVFISYGYAKPWDGAKNGKDSPVGTYYYTIEFNDPTSAIPRLNGDVSIIR